MVYCTNCGNEIQEGTRHCPICGTPALSSTSCNDQFNIKRVPKNNQKKMRRIVFCIVLGVLVISIFSFLRSRTYLNGTYECLDGSWTFVLKQEDRESGTFELYIDGESPDKENRRYTKTWEKDDDILTLEYDDDTIYYFLVVDGGLIMLEDEDEEPDFSDYIAPEGNSFDYEIGNMIFHEDGTYESEMSNYGTTTGRYYRARDIIYCKKDGFRITESQFGNTAIYAGESEYSPSFWIYDDDRIASAYDVYLKK